MRKTYKTKLMRAIEHANSLQAAVERWAQGDPCVIITKADVKTRKHDISVEVVRQPTDPLIPVLIGDCVHNARQSLDHLAYQLAISVSGSDPPPNENTSEFPIIDRDRHQFDSCLSQKIGRKKSIPTDLYAFIEGLQPYNGGNGEWLAVLHGLDNMDKHRFPPVVAGIGQVGQFNIGTLSVSQLVGPRLGPIEHGTPVIEFTPLPGSPVDMNFNLTPSIAFDKGSPVASAQPVFPVLANILALTQNIIAEVEALMWPFG